MCDKFLFLNIYKVRRYKVFNALLCGPVRIESWHPNGTNRVYSLSFQVTNIDFRKYIEYRKELPLDRLNSHDQEKICNENILNFLGKHIRRSFCRNCYNVRCYSTIHQPLILINDNAIVTTFLLLQQC